MSADMASRAGAAAAPAPAARGTRAAA